MRHGGRLTSKKRRNRLQWRSRRQKAQRRRGGSIASLFVDFMDAKHSPRYIWKEHRLFSVIRIPKRPRKYMLERLLCGAK